MTRVIHTGDTHVGYRQYHSPERRQDFLDAFEAVVADAVDDDVDAVVHAGDLFHDRRPELQDLLGVLSVLRELDDADVPFLAVVGNHEATRGGQWLDLFESLGLATRLGSEPVVVGDTAFYGLDHVPESRRDELDYRFAEHDAAHAALVSHGLFTPFAHANWDTETVLESANVDFDAVLLGDNHEAGSAEVLGTWVTYCGSTERASASEREGRGYNLVTFGVGAEATDEGGEAAATPDDAVDIRRRALDTRPFRFVSVDLGEGEGVDRVRERVRQHELEDAVVIVEIDGDGEAVTPASVEEYATERGALVARVTDRRELETESEFDVSFADPDAAVRERVEGMGLSTAALDVDETIRASKVADSKVRQEVTTRVESLLDDPESFAAADPQGDESEPGNADSDTGADANADVEPRAAADATDRGRDPDGGGGPDGESEPDDGRDHAPATVANGADGTDARDRASATGPDDAETGAGSDATDGDVGSSDGVASGAPAEATTDADADPADDERTDADPADDEDGQVSMEDFR